MAHARRTYEVGARWVGATAQKGRVFVAQVS